MKSLWHGWLELLQLLCISLMILLLVVLHERRQRAWQPFPRH